MNLQPTALAQFLDALGDRRRRSVAVGIPMGLQMTEEAAAIPVVQPLPEHRRDGANGGHHVPPVMPDLARLANELAQFRDERCQPHGMLKGFRQSRQNWMLGIVAVRLGQQCAAG
ncbi:hypothetical protein D9M71_516880 [compost metagenome]